jgi:hypothetical protein
VTDIPPAQPMTRRERRALEEQALLAASSPTPPAAPTVPSVPPVLSTSSAPTPLVPPPAAIPGYVSSLPVSPPPVAPAAPVAAVIPPPLVSPVSPSLHPVAPPAPVASQPATRRERRMLEETGAIPIPREYQAPPAPSVLEQTSLVDITQAVPPQPAPPEAEPLPPVFGTTTGPVPAPVEHAEPPAYPNGSATTFPSRIVGDVTSATSSLILPTAPSVDLTGPIGDTGEIVVTGQIALPHRLSETGTIPSMHDDRDDEDRFDAYVTGELAAMSQPIRAVKAVSGQGDETDILLVRRVRWGTATILASTGAAILGVGAVVLLVIALMTDSLV